MEASERVLAEAEAVWRARGDHVVGLLDVAEDDDGLPVLVLEEPEHSLDSVLRRAPALGAAVTLLLPIAEALQRMHVAGVAHRGIEPSAIRVDEHGAPMLVGFGSASLADGPSPDAAVDVAALRVLALHVLAGVRCTETREIDARERLRHWLTSPAADRADLEGFAARIRGLAEPTPLPLTGPPLREDPPEPLVQRPEPPAGSPRRIGRVRARFWVPAAAMPLALVAALVLVPTGRQGASAEPPTVETVPGDPVTAAAFLVDPAPTDLVLIERIGDAAIVRGSRDGAELRILLIRSAAGWTVRSVYRPDAGE